MMLSLLSLSLLASCVHSAILKRQSCGDTTWTTVTPSAVTESTYIDLDVFYTTTVVTAYALSPSAPTTTSTVLNAPSKRMPAPQQTAVTTAVAPVCADAIVSTTTAPTPTTTETTTYTFSHAARSTTYLPACDPSSNYGLFNGSLNINSRGSIGQPQSVSYSNMSIADCCEACFTGEAGCLNWSFNGAGSCSVSLVDAGCPAGGAGTEVIVYPNNEKAAIGMGPCDVSVVYFQNG